MVFPYSLTRLSVVGKIFLLTILPYKIQKNLRFFLFGFWIPLNCARGI